mmetsp:Transcript_32894/g.43360  ORF Transcript_32894/g.43360 Transcript_32894/m.43360 type:complete len:92 (-) Transcript_32894:361-636(-)
MLFFRVMVNLCGKKAVCDCLGSLDQTFTYSNSARTWVHSAVESKYLRLVNEVLIDEVGFEPDFYTPQAKQTLVHTFIVSSARWFLSESHKE